MRRGEVCNMSKIKLKDDSEAESKNFCAAIGELILWAAIIDGQLNKALIAILALPEHAFLEPIIAQLDARAKAELLKKRAKLITQSEWRNGVKNWVERTEKINAKRNFVAHHSIRVLDGKLVLHSDQLTKIFDTIDSVDDRLVSRNSRDISDVQKWIDLAKTVYEEGATVIENLEQVRDMSSKALADTNRV